MRKIIALAVLFLGMGCQKSEKENTDFRGIGEFEIGKEFKTLASAGVFREIMPGEYSAPRFELSGDLGEVSNLYVVTSGGKISQVRFATNGNTQLNNLSKVKRGLVLPTVPVENKNVGLYSSRDGAILYFETRYPGQGSLKPYTEIMYSDSLALQKDLEHLQRRLGVK